MTIIPKKSSLRVAARVVLRQRGFDVRVKKAGQGYLPGSRVLVERGEQKFEVAVKASKERALSFTRQPDGEWRTLRSVGMVIAVVPALANPNDFEVIGFQKEKLVEAFDRAWQMVYQDEHKPVFNIPTFIPLDDIPRKNVGHAVANLTKLADWHEPLTSDEIETKRLIEEERATSAGEIGKNYIDVFIRRFAKENGVDLHRVFIGIGGHRK